MRKRNISFIVDKLLWFIILILPLLFALVFTCASMNNYQLEVSASESDNAYDYVKYDLTTDSYERSIYFYLFSTNLRNNCIYLPSDYDGSVFITTQYADVELFYSSSSDGCFVNNDYGTILLSNDTLSFDSYIAYTFTSNWFSGLYWDYENDGIFIGIYLELGGYDGFCYILSSAIIPQSDNIFKTYFANLNYSLDNWFTFGERDIVYNAFNSIFGSQSNIMPIFVEGSFIPKYLTYMSWIYVLHLAFDFLVFIPRLAHKWMGGVYRDDE